MAKRKRARRTTASAAAGKASDAHEYPRPQLVRDNWTSLNGAWDFAIDADARRTSPEQVKHDRRIIVPFAPETPASGVGDTGFYRQCWYARTIETPQLSPDQRLILHFGAVDYAARVWVNGKLAVEHEGGYTPFSADITDLLAAGGTSQRIDVCAIDDPHDLCKPRGKQDWLLDAHSIWYPRTTGIWQTVWTEVVPATRIAALRWEPAVERSEVMLHAKIDALPAAADAANADELQLRVRLNARNRTIVDDVYSVRNNEVIRAMAIGEPGVEDFGCDLLWSPDNPQLIDAEVELLAGGRVIDRVRSYTALRSVAVERDRFLLNRRPILLRLVLDQGYWQETGLTPPGDQAIRRDVELVKAMGFNGVRKHQKIEDPRFLYWADRLGLLVWEEMPSPYRFGHVSIARTTRDWTRAIERDFSHPCIIVWVPLNESWGVPDLPQVSAQREMVSGLFHLTKALDPTRPVVGNDGWEIIASDIIAIHDYDADPRRLAQRYDRDSSQLQEMFNTQRPGHRVLLLEGYSHEGKPIMLTEFGGIAFSQKRGSWGYSRAGTADQFAQRYGELLAAVRGLPLLAGFCYTQFTDTYQEANGLLYMDRTPKFPIQQIARLTRG